MITIITDLRWEIEGYTKSTYSLGEEIMVSLVTLFSRGEACILAHRPELSAVHVFLYATRERIGAWHILRQSCDIRRRIDLPDLYTRIRHNLFFIRHIQRNFRESSINYFMIFFAS